MRKVLDVTLRESDHVYLDTNQLRYTAVSHIISAFKDPFDPQKIMADGGTLISNYVRKHGETEEFWLNQWENKKNDACKRGTAFHKIREDAHNGVKAVQLHLRPEVYTVQDFQQITDRNPGMDYSKLPNGSYRELTLFNRRYMIAGQADNVTIEDGFVDIDDDKTNGEFNTLSFKPPRGNYKMLKTPLNKLMDCHLGHYTVQLSTYAWMLEQFGLKPRRLRLLHWTILPEHEEMIEAGKEVNIEPSQYIVNYERDTIEAMVKYYTNVIRRSR